MRTCVAANRFKRAGTLWPKIVLLGCVVQERQLIPRKLYGKDDYDEDDGFGYDENCCIGVIMSSSGKPPCNLIAVVMI